MGWFVYISSSEYSVVNLLPKYALVEINSDLSTFKLFDRHNSTCIDVNLLFMSVLDHFRWFRFEFYHSNDHSPIFIHGNNQLVDWCFFKT